MLDKYTGIRPSALPRLEACPGSAAMELGIERQSTEFAAEGTVAHLVCKEALEARVDCFEFVGKTYKVDRYEFVVDEAMAEHCQVYVDAIRTKATGKVLMVEKDVNLSQVFGIEGRKGQIDALIADANSFEIDDLKYGMGVKVTRTAQLEGYALAAIDELGDFVGDIKTVRMTIHQPRLNHIFTWELSVEELEERRAEIRAIALTAKQCIDKNDLSFTQTHLKPGDVQCKFCSAKSKCPSLAKFVEDQLGKGLNDEAVVTLSRAIERSAKEMPQINQERLSEYLKAVPLLRMWCDSIEARANADLNAGKEVPGFKLVEGRAGSRKWVDSEQATNAFKQMRLKDEVIFKQTLISPTQAEKLVKTGELGPRQWAKLQELVVRSEPKPTVVPQSDKREALSIQPLENDLNELVELTQKEASNG